MIVISVFSFVIIQSNFNTFFFSKKERKKLEKKEHDVVDV